MNKKGLGVTLINLGQLYTERSRHEEALKAYKESLQIQRDVGDENQQAFCLNNIGNVYLAKGQSSDALTYYERALELRKKANVPSQIGESLGRLGREAKAWLREERIDEARQQVRYEADVRYFRQGYEFSLEID